MSRTSKEYCRVTILMLLTISLVIPPVASGANDGPGFAVGKAQAALRTKITGAWVDESIDKVLMDLADQAGVDIVKSPEVTGNVTAKITAVPLAEVLSNILAAHGFTYVATQNMIRVTAIPEIALAREELISKVYHITYADANDVAGALAGFVSDKGSVAFSRGTNHIVVTDTEKRIKAVDDFVAEIDRQTQQVLVEVKIYEITTSEGFDLGSAFRAARNIEYENVGATNPTTTTTTTTPGYDITTSNRATEQTPGTTTITETPQHTIESIQTRTEQSPSVTTATLTPGHDIETTENRAQAEQYSTEDTQRFGTDYENIDYWNDGIDRTDTTTQRLPDILTTSTTETNGSFIREDVSTQRIPDIRTTETTETGGLFVREETNREVARDVTATETTTVAPGSTGYYTRKRGKPFVGASFDPQQGGTLSFSLLDDAVDFEFALNVLKKEVESKLLANPRILVVDNETANFEIVREVPYRELLQVAREDPVSYTDFKNVGVQLNVTPHIARGGLIRLRIAPEFSILVSQDAYGVPTVDARRADTTALIRDGQTIAIGGLRKRETSKSIAKVPLLGDIPLLGNLFRSSSEAVQINELVVLITPRIIDSLEPTPAVLSEDGENGIPKVFRGDKEFAKPQAVGMAKTTRTKAAKPKARGAAEVKPLESFDKTPQTAEQTPQTTLQVAYGYLKMGRFDLAKEKLASVLAAQPDNSTAHQYLGYCHLKSGDLDAAIQSYLTAVDLNIADFEAHRGLGVAYMLKARGDGDPDLAARAVEQWQISLDINPDQANAPALRKMIEAYTR